MQSDNLIFLTSYCNIFLLRELRSKGFKVIQLVLDRDEFNRRNEKRMTEEGYDDANIWANQIFGFHQEIKDKELVDLEVNVDQPVEDVAKEILGFLEKESVTSH